MNHLIVWIVGFTALGGMLSILAAGSYLLLPAAIRDRLISPLISFATGALLGAAFLALLPHALESPGIEGTHSITLTVLFGLLVFFLLEKLVLWRHCHKKDCEAHTLDEDHARSLAAGKLILIGDGIHNLLDGVLIAAAFLTDIHLGVVTSFAVIAHEIPQEVGDFAVLLQGGYSRAKALLYNGATSLSMVIGGVAAFFSLSLSQQLVPYILALAASSFIYIAVADLIPGLHKRLEISATVQQVILIGVGVGVIYLAHAALH